MFLSNHDSSCNHVMLLMSASDLLVTSTVLKIDPFGTIMHMRGKFRVFIGESLQFFDGRTELDGVPWMSVIRKGEEFNQAHLREPARNMFTWNSLMSGYVRNDQDVPHIFLEQIIECVRWNAEKWSLNDGVMMLSLLNASPHLRSLTWHQSIPDYLMMDGFEFEFE